jgi:RNA polymerase sigma-70 factor (ECF subfamily)
MDTVTSTTLLEGLMNRQDSLAWRRFHGRYEPMVMSFARKLGLNDSDAQDVGQEVMLAFVQEYWGGRYDRAKGRLRSWLFGIAHRKVIDLRRKKAKEAVVADRTDATGFMERLESPQEAEAVWEEEWQRFVLRACLDEVGRHLSPTTVKAFDLYVLKQWPVEKVADHLGITQNSVYIAKNRTMERIRQIKAEMEEIW